MARHLLLDRWAARDRAARLARAVEAVMGRRINISCENCCRQERGMSPTLDGWLLCSYCHDLSAGTPPRKTLQRLFRIRRRRGADGHIIFERYE